MSPGYTGANPNPHKPRATNANTPFVATMNSTDPIAAKARPAWITRRFPNRSTTNPSTIRPTVMDPK